MQGMNHIEDTIPDYFERLLALLVRFIRHLFFGPTMGLSRFLSLACILPSDPPADGGSERQ